jgi:hypothetical protein
MTCTFTDVQWQSWNTWSCMDVSSERSSRSRALYMAIHGLLRRSKNILYSYSVCRFLKKEKITYYIDILRGFSVKTKQQHIKLIIILRVSILRTKERHWYRAYSMHIVLLYIAWFLVKWTKQQHIIGLLIYCVV